MPTPIIRKSPAKKASASKKPATKKAKVTSQDFYMLLDRSGSMESIRDDVIGGVNAFIGEQQKTKGTMHFTLVQFDNVNPFEIVADAIDVKKAEPLTTATYIPRGGTPLLDSLGKTLAKAEAEVVEGANVVFAIVTDGQENASTEFRLDDIRKKIAALEAKGWIFAFIGANQDSFAEATRFGSSGGATMDFTPDAHGVKTSFARLSASNSGYRVAASGGKRLSADAYLVPGTSGKGPKKA